MNKLGLSGKLIAVAIAVVAMLFVSFASTLALIIVKTNELVNTFQAGEINILVDANNKKILNQSDVDVYVRVAVVANYQDAGGNVYEGAIESTDYTVVAGNGWVQDTSNAMIYYYTSKLAPNEQVDLPNVIKTTISKNGHQLKIAYVATGIQGNIHATYTEAWAGNN